MTTESSSPLLWIWKASSETLCPQLLAPSVGHEEVLNVILVPRSSSRCDLATRSHCACYDLTSDTSFKSTRYTCKMNVDCSLVSYSLKSNSNTARRSTWWGFSLWCVGGGASSIAPQFNYDFFRVWSSAYSANTTKFFKPSVVVPIRGNPLAIFWEWLGA